MPSSSRGQVGASRLRRVRPGPVVHFSGLLLAGVLLAPGLAFGQAALEWGPFRLVPTVQVTGTFTDNVVLAPSDEAESDFITTIGVGLALKLRGTNYGGNLGARADLVRYAENTQFDTTRYTVFADGRWETLYRRLNLTLSEEFKRTDEFVGGPVPEFTELVEHYENTLEFEAEYRVAEAWSVGVGYRFYLLDYIDSSFDDLDYTQHTLHLAVYYRIFPKTALLGRYDYQWISYSQDSIRDSDSHFGWIGLRGDLTGKTSAEIRIGAQHQDFSDGSSETNWVAHASVIWKYRDPSYVRVFVERSNPQSTYFQIVDGAVLDNTYLATYGGVEVGHRWTPQIAVKLFGLVGTNDYPDETLVAQEGLGTVKRLDWIYAAGIGVRYDFRRWLALELGYALRIRDSNISNFDYTENRVIASIVFTY